MLHKRSLSNPIRALTLERLSAQIDAFQNGYLAEFALTADAMENRDDMLKNVITKRKKAVTRHGWEILVEDCSDEARAQRDALDYFYRNLTCTHALRPNERGGFQLLIYQMMDAVGKGYAVHEILWKPMVSRVPSLSSLPSVKTSAAHSSISNFALRISTSIRAANVSDGAPELRRAWEANFVTAQFRFVPLWYFESTSGPLRFLTTPGALHGQPMAERDWLVTTGDALMIACSRAFLFKHYPLQAWLDFSEKFGLPGVRAITSAARGTPEFAEMEDALQSFMKELSVVTNTAESIDVIDLKGAGQPPFPELVERMDRVMASLWRGADLSTLSRDRGYGATLQEQESRILELDDARALSEHLNSTLDRWVLEQLFGPNVTPLARVKILVTPQECTPHDLAIDQFLIAHGARLPLSQTLERYGRVQAKPDEPALSLESTGGTSRARSATTLNRTDVTSPKYAASSPSRPSAHSAFGIRTSNFAKPSTFNLKPIMKSKLHNSTIAQSSPLGPEQNSSFDIRTSKFPPSTSDFAFRTSHLPNDSSSPASDSSSPENSTFGIRTSIRAANASNGDTDSRRAREANSAFSSPQSLDDFIHLSPLGLFPHANGFQNVDRTALETLVKNFKSFFGRLGRRFAGLPFYIGHPDVPGYENVYSDRKAYGWIMDLEVREDGLYGRTNWSAAGRELISNGHFKFLSPYWEAIRIGERNGRGVFSPTVLKSVGLTNQPNLPVLPLANTDSPHDHTACLGTSISLTPTLPLNPALNLNPDPTMNSNSSLPNTGGANVLVSPDIAAEEENLKLTTHNSQLATPSHGGVTSVRAANVSDGDTDSRRARETNLPQNPNIAVESPSPSPSEKSDISNQKSETRAFELRHSNLETSLASLEASVGLLHHRLITTLLDNAIAGARILPIERPHWENALHKNFEETSAALANAAPKLNLTSRTDSLPRVNAPLPPDQKQKRILSLVHERMRSTGTTYHDSWIETRSEHPSLF